MESIKHKNVIIGAGAMGSAAAYHLARRGEPVLLIEQFALGHDRGSSHGAVASPGTRTPTPRTLA